MFHTPSRSGSATDVEAGRRAAMFAPVAELKPAFPGLMARLLADETFCLPDAICLDVITCQTVEAQDGQVLGDRLYRLRWSMPAPATAALHLVVAVRIGFARGSGGVHHDGGKVTVRRRVLRRRELWMGAARVSQEPAIGRRSRVTPPPPRTVPTRLRDLLAPAFRQRGGRLGVRPGLRVDKGDPFGPADPRAGRREGARKG